MPTYPNAFTPDVKSVLNENLGGILGGTLSYILKQQWCLSIWSVLGKFFLS